MFAKRSLLLLVLILFSVFVDASIKIKTFHSLHERLNLERKYKNSKGKSLSHRRTQKSNLIKKYLAIREPNQCVDKGMGFKGFQLTDIPKLLSTLKGNEPKMEEFSKYIQPIIEKIVDMASNFFDFAIGDYTGLELARMDNLLCNVVPFEPDASMGTIALKLSNLPCGKSTSITVCFTFSQCGSFSLSFNGGLLSCAVSTTGIGQLVAPFLNAIENVGFGFSINNRIIQTYTIHIYDNSNKSFPERTVIVKGNLYFTLGVSIADVIFPDNVKVAGKKIGDLLEIKGTMNVIIDFGKTFSNLAGVIEKGRSGSKVNFMDVIKSFLQSGAEIALAIKASVMFKLSVLTKGFLPDINIAKIDFNMLNSLGGGNSGVSKGIYLNLHTQLTFLQSFYEGFRKTIGKVIEFFGIKLPNLDLNIKVKIAISIQDEVFGIMLKGNLGSLGGDITCLYRYKDDNLSCNGASLNPFSIIKDGIQWVVKKAGQFFQHVGNEIRVAFDKTKKWMVTNIIEPASRFFKGEGKMPSTCVDGMENSVGLCYPKCRSGFYGVLTQCIQNCPDGYRNDGYFCFKPRPYGRGAGYVIWNGNKCNRNNPNTGCEKWGWMWYPRCRPLFHPAGCCICSPNCPSGMSDIGISCQKTIYGRGVGKMPGCAKDEDSIAGLCYKQRPNRNYYKLHLRRMRYRLLKRIKRFKKKF